jgi:Tol biopolymer transport system component
LIAYQSRESGDWEAYIIGENGANILNVSNSPNSSDGLPTISPDGQWIAFASDREGPWAVYVAPISGGPAQKLFDFPKANPWGTGNHDWTNERMSWGR